MRRLFIALLALLLLAGCAVNPVTGRTELALISESQEIALGRQHYTPTQQMQGGPYNADPELTRYVNAVGQRLARVSDRPDLPYEFVVINDSTPNAWALPGGKIGINRGLLVEMDSEGELAAVLSHEIVHAAARHGARNVERGLMLQVGVMAVGASMRDQRHGQLVVAGAGLGAGLIAARYSREAEREADHYGMIYMSRAGYDPAAAITLQETFVRLAEERRSNWLAGLFASHPPSQERVEANRATAASLPAGGRVGQDEYRLRIATLTRAQEAYEQHDEGRQALHQGDHAKALRLAGQALAQKPNEALFHGLRGDALYAAGRHDEALAAYDTAIAHNRDFFHFWLQRGLLRNELGDRSGAREDLAASNRLLPTSVAHNALGRLALAAGDRGTAISHFTTAAEARGSEGDEARRMLARLQLGSEPARFIDASGSLDGQGRLLITVHNRAALPVRDIVLQVRQHDAQGRPTGQQRIAVRGPLAAGATVRATTGLGPLSREALARLSVQVVEARLVE